MKTGWKFSSIIYVLLLAAMAWFAYSLFTTAEETRIDLSTAITLSQSNNVGKAVVTQEEQLLTLTIKGAPPRVSDIAELQKRLAEEPGDYIVVARAGTQTGYLVEIARKLPEDERKKLIDELKGGAEDDEE